MVKGVSKKRKKRNRSRSGFFFNLKNTLRQWAVTKSQRRNKLIWTGAILGIVLGVVSIPLIDKQELFVIKNIVCTWDEQPCPRQVTKVFAKVRGQSLLGFDTQGFKNNIVHNNPRVGQIAIKKIIPSTIIFTFSSRRAVLALEDKKQNYYLVDATYKVFDFDQEKKLPVLKVAESVAIGETQVNPKVVATIDLAGTLNESLLVAKSMKFIDEDSLEVVLSSGKKAIFSFAKDTATQVDALQYILHSSKIDEKTYSSIDLRFKAPVLK